MSKKCCHSPQPLPLARTTAFRGNGPLCAPGKAEHKHSHAAHAHRAADVHHEAHGHACHAHHAPKAKSDAPVAPGTIYTCPMHPEIRQVGPGHCPICGMALEPEMPSEHADESELIGVRRKFWVALALSLPVVAIAMIPHLFDLHLSQTTAGVLRGLEMILSAPVVLWAALDYYKRGWLGVVNRSPNMYTLIGLGVCIAFIYSIVATFAARGVPARNAR